MHGRIVRCAADVKVAAAEANTITYRCSIVSQTIISPSKMTSSAPGANSLCTCLVNVPDFESPPYE